MDDNSFFDGRRAAGTGLSSVATSLRTSAAPSCAPTEDSTRAAHGPPTSAGAPEAGETEHLRADNRPVGLFPAGGVEAATSRGDPAATVSAAILGAAIAAVSCRFLLPIRGGGGGAPSALLEFMEPADQRPVDLERGTGLPD